MISPATAFQLAYLSAARVTLTARHELVERNAGTVDAKLKHALEFSRGALGIEESKARDADAKLAQLREEKKGPFVMQLVKDPYEPPEVPVAV